MHISEIETPAVVVDLDIMERNLRRVADYCAAHQLRLRPHTKTHKSPMLAKRQLELGAAGLTVAKTGEAEVMLRSGTSDLLITYPVIGASKLERLSAVARKTRVTVALDSEYAARGLSEAAVKHDVSFGVLAETDVGLNRVGVDPGDDLVALAKLMASLPGLQFEGIDFYPGHIKANDEPAMAALREVGKRIDRMLADLHRAGLSARIVSGGSTPSLFHSHELSGLNEIRPGTYIFNDLNTWQSGACTLDDCAASILATVVSTARPGQMILDGGSKTFSSDRLNGTTDVTFGRIVEAPGARFHKMNEEHGYVDISKAERRFEVGEQVHVIPNHICVAVNLHEKVYGVRGEQVEQVWNVEARGKLQ